MRSMGGVLGASILLLALPVTIVYALIFSAGSEVVIHVCLALGAFLVATAARDFRTPTWATWLGSASGAALGVAFGLQAVSAVVPNDWLYVVAYTLLGRLELLFLAGLLGVVAGPVARREPGHPPHPGLGGAAGRLRRGRDLRRNRRRRGERAAAKLAAGVPCVLEALQNCAKHAPGAAARVSLSSDAEWLRFAVADDGPGFARAAVDRGSGLQGMVDRVAAVGGTLEVRSATGQGTTIAARMPAARTPPRTSTARAPGASASAEHAGKPGNQPQG